ncbi:hypothetical protein DPMN_103914 [Dreissena polymorpha]|uniref:Uncharacterized protein n=1 Tax=Dreissena polymorpha TaxID=45954 RepID=A0A9D4HAZ4_DREPO|nr:hypothetical protein DPMN_103914 [Dreissena polymorpha]
MTSQRYFVCLGFLLGGIAQFAESLFINGCPMFGFRPSGSFSFDQHLPGPDAAINWVSDLKLQPLPKPYGCVTDSSSIICLNNDVFSENQAYVSLHSTNGSLHWKDKILHYPSLPLLDNFGDVTGSDGSKLVHYDQDGTQYPVINLQDLRPSLIWRWLETMSNSCFLFPEMVTLLLWRPMASTWVC